MLDQSFSAENLNRIFLLENRKGTFSHEFFPADFITLHGQVKLTIAQLKNLRARADLQKTDLEELEKELKKKIEQLNADKQSTLYKYLIQISNSLCKSDFKFILKKFVVKGAIVYSLENDANSFFADKQLQQNLSRVFKVKPNDRHSILKQLYEIINDKYPKLIIRTDIKGFYESIPQERLFKTINDNQLLSAQSKQLIVKLFYEFELIKDTAVYPPKVGIPRGVGISAYLAELYMRQIDNAVKRFPNLIYYGRYVDDVVLIFSSPAKTFLVDHLKEFKELVERFSLKIKDGSDGGTSKTSVLDLTSAVTADFSYLGYKFFFNNSLLEKIRWSDDKLDRFKVRLTKMVETYNFNSRFEERNARKLLRKRLKFLTSNYYLLNNKSHVKSGALVSNFLLLKNSNHSYLNYIDQVIKGRLSQLKPHIKLNIDGHVLRDSLLANTSFKDALLNPRKSFVNFSAAEMQQIKKIWK